ncbi:hypothetical protein XELAEV_18021954mg [Xenopus laevis]|uniref:Uncharacterized protein n=1 Tax=Xenopus laevis TaxID=8355 RepID=A0A974D3E3_XENLA|nr:hypothetical protein XELAEV_18021954mg [Xenopus laevis]
MGSIWFYDLSYGKKYIWANCTLPDTTAVCSSIGMFLIPGTAYLLDLNNWRSNHYSNNCKLLQITGLGLSHKLHIYTSKSDV